MIDREQTFTCDICGRTEKHDGISSYQKMPLGWWSLQCTRDYCSLYVKDVCASCWGLLFMRLFPKTEPEKESEICPDVVAPPAVSRKKHTSPSRKRSKSAKRSQA